MEAQTGDRRLGPSFSAFQWNGGHETSRCFLDGRQVGIIEGDANEYSLRACGLLVDGLPTPAAAIRLAEFVLRASRRCGVRLLATITRKITDAMLPKCDITIRPI